MVTTANGVRLTASGICAKMAEFYCLSTDTKPTENVANGSCLYEMDTGAFYFFDDENRRWLPMKGGG